MASRTGGGAGRPHPGASAPHRSLTPGGLGARARVGPSAGTALASEYNDDPMDEADRSPLSADHIEALRALGERFGVSNIRVFGSRARGEAVEDSDLDLLVSLDYRPGVARRLVRFCAEASRLLGVKVDVVTDRALDARLHAPILSQARPL